jgi:hypothetical protein
MWVYLVAQILSRDFTIVLDALKLLRKENVSAYLNFRQHYALSMPDEFGKTYISEEDLSALSEAGDEAVARLRRQEPHFRKKNE